DWAWSRTLTVEFAGTVTPVNVGPVADPVVVASFAVHPTATRSSGFVIATVTVSAALPEFFTTRVSFRNRPSQTPDPGSRHGTRRRTRRMPTLTSRSPTRSAA